MARRYAILDVFTNSALAGNPLAVVLDAEGLSDDQMQSITREFNLSETVFVLPADNPGHSASLRIFTPACELPFAGHPTVGTSILLAMERFGQPEGEQDAVIVLNEKIGAIRCGVILKQHAAGFAEFDIPKLPDPVGTAPEREAVASALGLEPSEIGFENHRPSIYSAGVAFHLVPVRDMETLSRAAPAPVRWRQVFASTPSQKAYVYCRQTQAHDSGFHARMFAPELGITEDPATGSAVAAFSGAIHLFDDLPSGTHFYRIEQGFEMGRPSLIDLEIDIENGSMHTVRIGGQAVLIARGELFI